MTVLSIRALPGNRANHFGDTKVGFGDIAPGFIPSNIYNRVRVNVAIGFMLGLRLGLKKGVEFSLGLK